MLGMERKSRYAVMKNAPPMLRKEGYIGSMEQRQLQYAKPAVMQGVPIFNLMEEFVLDMERSAISTHSAMNDATTKLTRKE